jgi:hypothetical protein
MHHGDEIAANDRTGSLDVELFGRRSAGFCRLAIIVSNEKAPH